ncbi:hypothetical protein WJX84_005352 [Apatococcus fuscideae]|uniref:26S proteasome complex subunit SEM1 n=1 Tax=Apatococcus fuscideae TaxID=2026836 RepID=A0AAW1T3U6_9CHLO
MVETEAQKQKPHLEDEDLFEEFLLEEGEQGGSPRGGSPQATARAAAEGHLWEADWDDEDVGTDFMHQLQQQLAKIA